MANNNGVSIKVVLAIVALIVTVAVAWGTASATVGEAHGQIKGLAQRIDRLEIMLQDVLKELRALRGQVGELKGRLEGRK
ncbi:MAG: hypothetical protein DRJ03_07295 [Chloroflexi bacterium]|nr:MAG: hypothetical protein DRJ03_07295 [Chloroflexota bacterium]